MSNLILTICSKAKLPNDTAQKYDVSARTAASVLLDDMRWKKLYETRNRAFQHIENSTRKGGFSAKPPLNEELKHGPDIDHDSQGHEGCYIPALKRYDGKFYPHCENQTGTCMLPELGKAAGLLLSRKTTQKLSEIEHLDKIKDTLIKSVSMIFYTCCIHR